MLTPPVPLSCLLRAAWGWGSGLRGAGAQGQGPWEVSCLRCGRPVPRRSLGRREERGPPGGEARAGTSSGGTDVHVAGGPRGGCTEPWGVGRQQGFHIWPQDSGGAGRGPGLNSTGLGPTCCRPAGQGQGPGRGRAGRAGLRGAVYHGGRAQDREGLPPQAAWPSLPPWGGTLGGGGAQRPAQWEGRGAQPAFSHGLGRISSSEAVGLLDDRAAPGASRRRGGLAVGSRP